MVLRCLGLWARSRPCDQIIVGWRHKMGNLKLAGPSQQLTAVPGLSWMPLLITNSFLSQNSFLLRNGAGTPSWAAHFPFHGSFYHFPANQNSETFVNQIILTISG